LQQLILVMLTWLMLPVGSLAATIAATPTSETISVGGQATIHFDLVLDAGEPASVLELKLDLVGLGGIADADLTPCGGWGGLRDGGVSGSQAIASCTAGAQQETGTVLSAEISVTGLAPGIFQLFLAADTFAQRDTDTPPFVEDLPLGPSTGTLLATVTVVPEPATALLGGFGLLALAAARRRPRCRGIAPSRRS
jgi:hypothetical protein